MQSTKLKEGQGKREGERPERRLRPGKSLERGSTVQYRLNHIQRALVVVIIGAMTGNGFNSVAGVTHGERKRRHVQHFGVVAAIANRYTLLRRQLPAFQQTGNAVGFVQTGNNQVDKTKAAGHRLHDAIQRNMQFIN